MKYIIFFLICSIGAGMYVICDPNESQPNHIEVTAGFFDSQHPLEDYVSFLLQHNPKLSQLNKEAEALRSEISAVETLADPTVGVGLFLSEVQTRVGPQQQKISVRQKLPWPGKLALKGEVVEARSKQIDAKYETAKREIVSMFKKTYSDLFYLGRQINSNHEHLQILRDFEQVLTTKYQNGLAPYANIIRVQLEIDKFEDRIAELTSRQEPVSSKLMAFLGVASQETYAAMGEGKVLPLIPFPSSLPEENHVSRKTTKISNPQLNEIQFKTMQQKVLLQLENKRTLPDFQVGLDWIGTGSSSMPDTAGSGRDAVAVSVSMNIPIWNKKYSALKRGVAHRIEATEQQYLDKENQLTSQLQSAYYSYEDAIRKEKLYRDQIIPKAEETLNILLTAFESDQTTYLDILDAERALLDFSLSLEKAKSNVFKAITEIERITK